MKQTTYHKEKIGHFVIKSLTEANRKIHLAIGWIDDTWLEALLLKKALAGVEVTLILIKDQDYESKLTSLQELIDKGVRVIALDTDKREHLIDHKFGVIDGSIVLTGNYGWGYKNAPQEEHLSVTEGVPTLANGFEMEFEYLIESLVSPGAIFQHESRPANAIVPLLKKMGVVKTFLCIGDTEFLHLHFKEFENYLDDKNVVSIHNHLLNKNYEEALELIRLFIRCHQPLRACVDPPIDSLRREIRLLEEDIATVSHEYNETQKMLHKFSKMHTNWLGDLLQDLLYQTKIKANIEAKENEEDEVKQEEYEEAKNDHEEYTKSYEESKKQKLNVLTKEEQKELKKLYRQTSLKCHPDRVVDELYQEAEEIFVELNQAYKANDLERVREINEQLQPGIMLPKSEGITELKKLESTYKSLLQKLDGWQEKLTELKEGASYQTVSGIEDWETYFTERKEILEQQLERLIEFNESNIKLL